MNNTLKEAVQDDEIWEDMQTTSRDYKPTRYAKRDRHGNIVDHDERADATKAYLEKVHWGETSKTENRECTLKKLRLTETCHEIIHNGKSKFDDATYNTEPISTNELKACGKFKNAKRLDQAR